MPNTTPLTKSSVKDMIESASNKAFGVSAMELNKMQLYKCVATVVRAGTASRNRPGSGGRACKKAGVCFRSHQEIPAENV